MVGGARARSAGQKPAPIYEMASIAMRNTGQYRDLEYLSAFWLHHRCTELHCSFTSQTTAHVPPFKNR